MEIVLAKGKFISNGKMYEAGDILPDTPGARALVEMGRAGIVGGPESPPVAAPPPTPEENYGERTMRELTEMAKLRGLEVPKGMNKADLMALLAEHDGDKFGDAP